jgi:hypothetical protein
MCTYDTLLSKASGVMDEYPEITDAAELVRLAKEAIAAESCSTSCTAGGNLLLQDLANAKVSARLQGQARPQQPVERCHA